MKIVKLECDARRHKITRLSLYLVRALKVLHTGEQRAHIS